MTEARKHYQEIRNVLIFVLVLNWAVAFAKIIYGFITHSASMTADGFHSLTDGTSNIIGLVGIYFSFQPKDEDHPYGHKKYETLFALGIAAMLLMVAFNLAKEGVIKIIHPVVPQVDIISFVVMIITVAVNITVMKYEYKKGTRLHSDLLIVDSMHTKADIFTSLSVIVALVGVKLGMPIIDPIAMIIISIFIAYSAFEIIKQESSVLCDTVAIQDTQKIEDIVLKIKGAKACHKIRTRGRPDDINLDLHVQVAGGMTLNDAHQLSHIIQTEIMKSLPQIVDVMVHLEPFTIVKK